MVFRRPRVFCASLADWLDDEVPIEWLADLLRLIHDTPNLDWLLLTKRPQNFLQRVYDAAKAQHIRTHDHIFTWIIDWWNAKTIPHNVWVGTTVEDQQRADERIPELLKIPAHVRFLSAEPLLGKIDFGFNGLQSKEPVGFVDGIHWVIFGGESGKDARLLDVDWIRSGVKQCRIAGIAPFVKQLGKNVMGREMDKWVCRLTDKKGGDMSEWPEELRVREFPLPFQVGPDGKTYPADWDFEKYGVWR
jgi:protein gp37